jgi:hypothetical protein
MPPIGRKTTVFDEAANTFVSLARKMSSRLFQFGKEKSKMGSVGRSSVPFKPKYY